MAYETIKGLLANQAMRRMYANTPEGRAELKSKELANKMTEMQMDQLFPLQMKKLTSEIDFMLAEPEMQRVKLQQEKDIADRRMELEKQISEATLANRLEIAREETARKKTPSVVIQKSDRPAPTKIIKLHEDSMATRLMKHTLGKLMRTVIKPILEYPQKNREKVE